MRSPGLLCSEWWWEITTIRYVMTQKNVGLSYFAAEAWSRGYSTFQKAQTYSQVRFVPYSTVTCGKISSPRRRPHIIIASRIKTPIAKLPFQYTIICPGCCLSKGFIANTRVGTLIVATIYLQMMQNRYMLRSFTVLQCSHQHCVQPVASDVEVVGYL